MTYSDPYRPDQSVIECLSCGYRDPEADTPSSCPECGRPVQNLAVARE